MSTDQPQTPGDDQGSTPGESEQPTEPLSRPGSSVPPPPGSAPPRPGAGGAGGAAGGGGVGGGGDAGGGGDGGDAGGREDVKVVGHVAVAGDVQVAGDIKTTEKEQPKKEKIANPAAVAAFVVSLVALLCVLLIVTIPLGFGLAVLAIVLAAIALRKTREPDVKGKPFGIVGVLFGVVALVLSSAAIALFLALRDEEPGGDLAARIVQEQVRIAPTTSVFDLQIGDCFNEPLDVADFDEVPALPCSQPHRYEVFAVPRVQAPPGAPYPGVTPLSRRANGICQAQPFTLFVGEIFFLSPLKVWAFHPTPASWSRGDREIVCSITDPTRLTVGTLQGAGRDRPPVPSQTPDPLPPIDPSSLPAPPPSSVG